jgi:hypothetical protein
MMNSTVPHVVFVDKENTQPSPLFTKKQAGSKNQTVKRAAFGEINTNVVSNKSAPGKANTVVKPILKNSTNVQIQVVPGPVKQNTAPVATTTTTVTETTTPTTEQAQTQEAPKPKLTEAELQQKRAEAKERKLARQSKIFEQLEAAWNGHGNAKNILEHTIQDNGVYNFSFAPANFILNPILSASSSATKKKIEDAAWHLTQVFMLFKQNGFLPQDSRTFMKSPLAQPKDLGEKIVYDFCAKHVLHFPKDNKKMKSLDLYDKTVKYLGQRKMPYEFLVSLMSRNEIVMAVHEHLKKEQAENVHELIALANGYWNGHAVEEWENAVNSVDRAAAFKRYVKTFTFLRENFTEYRNSKAVQDWLQTKPWCGPGIVAKFDKTTLSLLTDKKQFANLLNHHKHTSEMLHLELKLKMQSIADEAE